MGFIKKSFASLFTPFAPCQALLGKWGSFQPARSGQATVEYLLIIVVVVTIGLVIGMPLGESLKRFSSALVGPNGYYACLMEGGYLPGEIRCEGLKQSAKANLNFSAGGVGGGLGGGGGSFAGGGSGYGSDGRGSSNSSRNTSSDNASSKNENQNSFSADKNQGNKNKGKKRGKSNRKGRKGQKGGGAGTSSDSSDADLNSAGGSGVQQGQSAFLTGANTGESAGEGGEGSSSRRKKIEIDLDDEGGGGGFKKPKKKKSKKRFRPRYGGGGYLGEQYYFEEEERENQPAFEYGASAQKRKSRLEGEEDKDGRLIKDRSKEEKKVSTEDKGMNFGAFLKYLIIAVLIVAVLVVIFSQVMEYQSRD